MLDLFLLFCVVAAAIWTVMTVRLIRAIAGLAITSAIIAVIMYRLQSPLAAVFELSVCAGLIPVIFITTVSFTQRISKEQFPQRRKERFVRFWYLPFIVAIVGILLSLYMKMPTFELPAAAEKIDVRNMLWNVRHLDLIGQVAILLAGVFAVVVLFKETKK